MKKPDKSLCPYKWLAAVFVLLLIAYGVLAVIYGLEQNAFRLPEASALPRAGGLMMCRRSA